MFPVVFEWDGAVFTTYSLLFSLAFFVGLGVSLAQAKRFGISGEVVVRKALGFFLWGLVGARLLFMLTQWPRFASGHLSVWDFASGGVVFYGGFLSALGYFWLSTPAEDRRLLLSLFAPGAAFAHAVGRIGCFANGCCHGRECSLPWAITITDPRSPAVLKGIPIHPTQLYEAGFLVFLGIVLWLLNRRPRSSGWTIKAYLVGYGIARFLLEFSRGDTARGDWLGISTSQWISIGLVLVGLSLDSKPLEGNNVPNENRNREPSRPL